MDCNAGMCIACHALHNKESSSVFFGNIDRRDVAQHFLVIVMFYIVS